MPDRGLLEPRSVAAGVIDGANPSDLVFEDARIVQATFEIARDAALAVMPCEVSRPVPCYGRILAIDSPQARFALVIVGGRYRMLPRNVVAQGVVDGDPRPLAEALGGPFAQGSVAVARDGERVELRVGNGSADGVTIALPHLRAIEPSMLRWDAWLTVARHEGALRLLELAPVAILSAAYLSKGATVTTAREAPAPWASLRSINQISACYGEGTIRIPAGVIQQPIEKD